ncbi:MAG: pyrroline-5-carboxylate reductase [Betaproteobacteria bacterium]|nr:pyrroline-5-carboxylate reductase [Betaproteobacteria bacterium]
MKIAFLGGGNMAKALIGGLLKTGFDAADIAVIEVDAEGRDKLEQAYGVRCYPAPDAAAMACDALLLAVKPQQMRQACAPLAPYLEQQLVISIAAGLRLADLRRWLGGHAKLVRAMPNTPALIGAGVTGLYAPPAVSADERAGAERILQAVGSTLWVADEAQMDALTAVSGSGPAYAFLFIEALQQAAAELGFPPGQARQLSVETALGAAKLAAQSDEPASVLRERVTSKGGTTEAALRAMAGRGVKDGIVAGILAADARGRALGELLGKDA